MVASGVEFVHERNTYAAHAGREVIESSSAPVSIVLKYNACLNVMIVRSRHLRYKFSCRISSMSIVRTMADVTFPRSSSFQASVIRKYSPRSASLTTLTCLASAKMQHIFTALALGTKFPLALSHTLTTHQELESPEK